MSSGLPKLSTSLDESQLSQVRECLATFTENISPGLHQDATMDNSYSMGFRSPSINALTGHGSPVQVRSLRENEEEISTLRKENFNLKLRIYFLEQKVGICTDSDTPGLGVTTASSSGTSNDGNYLKQNIDLKVEVESFRREVQEKQDLLCQAAKAIEVLEEGHRRTEEKHREMVNDLNNRIEMHQLEIKSLEKMASELQQQHRELQLSTSRTHDDGHDGHDRPTEGGAPEKDGQENVGESLLDFLDTVQQHGELSVQEKLKALEMENIIRQCQDRNEQLNRQVEQLQTMIDEKTTTINKLEVELGELRFQNAELREEKDKSQADNEVERLKKQIFQIRSQLAEKLCVLDDTEVQLKEKNEENLKACKMIDKLFKRINEQDMEMSKLKRNSNISLPSEHGRNSMREVHEILDQDQKPVSQAEYDELVQRMKSLQHKSDSLIHKLCGNVGNDDHRNDRNIIIKQLNDELIQAREETEKANKWRKECADLCALSTARLEELAGFLDSLLRNKELDGSLSIDRRKAIRKAVDRSLDLSRSLNMSISVTGFSLAGNNSLAQLSCLSGFLEHTIDVVQDAVPGESASDDIEEHDKENRMTNVTEQMTNHGTVGGNQTKQMIETLRAENRALRGKLQEQQQQQLRNKRREGKDRKSLPIEPISDSEAWSEPDRGVSLARIGLEDSIAFKQKNSTSVPVPALSASGQATSGVVELSSTSDNEVAVVGAGCALGVPRKSASATEMKHLHDMMATLNGVLREKDGTILSIQSQLVDLDSELKRERMRVADVAAEISGTRQQSERWEREAKESRAKAEQAMERLALLENDIRQKDEQIEKLRKEREQTAVNLRVALMKLETMHTEYDELQQRHKRELESIHAKQQQHIQELRKNLNESFRNELQLKQQSFDTALAQNYISKNIHQEKLRELDELHYQLEHRHNSLNTMMRTEEDLRQRLAECERTILTMQKTLDDATLQASKAVVERTKALNEKRQLETELGRTRDEVKQLKVEKTELNEKIQAMVQSQDVRYPSGSTGKSRSAETHDGGRHSSSATDEELTGRRRLENSSPDLGIESDPGRLSNVELVHVLKTATSPQQRPLLKTLELTKSMSNLLLSPKMDVKTEDGEASKCAVEDLAQTTTIVKHDCAKIEADYAELKRRYRDTRRCLTEACDNIKSANKRKERLEVDIKQQIHKTRVVLKTVHSNMASENEPL